jgi:hypothetical protein
MARRVFGIGPVRTPVPDAGRRSAFARPPCGSLNGRGSAHNAALPISQAETASSLSRWRRTCPSTQVRN